MSESPNWGMFTSEGNKRINNYAVTMEKKLEKVKGNVAKTSAAVESFYKKWRKLGDAVGFEEANDTDVREGVYYAGKEFIQKSLEMDSFDASELADKIFDPIMWS